MGAGTGAAMASNCVPVLLRMPKVGIIMPIMGMRTKSGGSAGRRRGARGTPVKTETAMGLAGALFTSTQRRMFGLLFGQPGRRFFANELIRLMGSGSGAVQRELQRLSNSGLVTVTKEGERKYFQANASAPIFEELQGIVLKTVGAAEPLQVALAPIAKQIHLALIYGSVARGTESASSDLDLFIVSDSLTLERLYLAVGTAERQLARKISVTLYTRAEYRRRLAEANSFLTKVLAGKNITLIGNPRELAATR